MAIDALAVCLASATATSYRQSYTETNIGGGNYMVVVEVNSKTSYATARQYAFRRAAEVCAEVGSLWSMQTQHVRPDVGHDHLKPQPQLEQLDDVRQRWRQ